MTFYKIEKIHMEKQKTNAVMESKKMPDVLLAFKSCDFSMRMPKYLIGIGGKLPML